MNAPAQNWQTHSLPLLASCGSWAGDNLSRRDGSSSLLLKYFNKCVPDPCQNFWSLPHQEAACCLTVQAKCRQHAALLCWYVLVLAELHTRVIFAYQSGLGHSLHPRTHQGLSIVKDSCYCNHWTRERVNCQKRSTEGPVSQHVLHLIRSFFLVLCFFGLLNRSRPACHSFSRRSLPFPLWCIFYSTRLILIT